MRTWAVALAFMCCGVSVSANQQIAPAQDRVRLMLPATVDTAASVPAQPMSKSWHGVTLAEPDALHGEFVRLNIPLGDFTMKTTRAIRNARHRGAERKARQEVERALQAFLKQQQQ